MSHLSLTHRGARAREARPTFTDGPYFPRDVTELSWNQIRLLLLEGSRRDLDLVVAGLEQRRLEVDVVVRAASGTRDLRGYHYVQLHTSADVPLPDVEPHQG